MYHDIDDTNHDVYPNFLFQNLYKLFLNDFNLNL